MKLLIALGALAVSTATVLAQQAVAVQLVVPVQQIISVQQDMPIIPPPSQRQQPAPQNPLPPQQGQPQTPQPGQPSQPGAPRQGVVSIEDLTRQGYDVKAVERYGQQDGRFVVLLQRSGDVRTCLMTLRIQQGAAPQRVTACF